VDEALELARKAAPAVWILRGFAGRPGLLAWGSGSGFLDELDSDFCWFGR
jgi:hypothetical protein